MQRNLAALADVVFPTKRDGLKDIFSTNAIFARSSKDDRLLGVSKRLFEECWPWHSQFLEMVQPRTIVAVGNGNPSPFSLISTKLRSTRSLGSNIPIFSTYSIKAVEGELSLRSGSRKVRLIGLPTLSRGDISNRREAMQELRTRGWLP